MTAIYNNIIFMFPICLRVTSSCACNNYIICIPYNFVYTGGLSGAAYWSAFYPADTVKSKIQTDPLLAKAQFADVFKVFFKIKFSLNQFSESMYIFILLYNI